MMAEQQGIQREGVAMRFVQLLFLEWRWECMTENTFECLEPEFLPFYIGMACRRYARIARATKQDTTAAYALYRRLSANGRINIMYRLRYSRPQRRLIRIADRWRWFGFRMLAIRGRVVTHAPLPIMRHLDVLGIYRSRHRCFTWPVFAQICDEEENLPR
jgi:hypothetical protein